MIVSCAGYSHWLPSLSDPLCAFIPLATRTQPIVSTALEQSSLCEIMCAHHEVQLDLTYLSYTWSPIVTARHLFTGCILYLC